MAASLMLPQRPCPSGCGFVVTWHATHCCLNCKKKPGSHGPLCKKKKCQPIVTMNDDDDDEEDVGMDTDPVEQQQVEQAPMPDTTETPIAAPIVAAPAESASSGGWYPGKYLRLAHQNFTARMAEVKAAKAKGQYQFPRHPLRAAASALKSRRRLHQRVEGDGGAKPCGNLFLSIIGGRYRTSRAYWIGELDGNEFRTSVASCTTPSWAEEEAMLPIYDPSSDLILLLFDNESHDSTKPVGRVILPLPSLCRGLRLSSSSASTRNLVARIMPVGHQHSTALLARYDEAVHGVPGSGMARPKHDLGTVELLVSVKFDAPRLDRFGLLAAYAHAPPPGEIVDDDHDEDHHDSSGGGGSGSGSGGGDAEATAKLQPKLLKLNATRLARCLGKPHLLRGPTSLVLPFPLYLSCFRLPLFTLPWMVLTLALANGLLAHHRRGEVTSELIFWEEEVGESNMPKGLIAKMKLLTSALAKMQTKLGQAATAMERSQNLLNWSEPPVTIAALVLLTGLATMGSLVLLLVPVHALAFCGGMAVLAPSLAVAVKELQGGGVDGGDNAVAAAAAASNSAPSSSTPPTPPPTQQQQQHGVKPKEEEAGGGGLAAVALMARNVLARVPDGRDTAHRHFAMSEQIVHNTIVEPHGQAAAAATAPAAEVVDEQVRGSDRGKSKSKAE